MAVSGEQKKNKKTGRKKTKNKNKNVSVFSRHIVLLLLLSVITRKSNYNRLVIVCGTSALRLLVAISKQATCDLETAFIPS